MCCKPAHCVVQRQCLCCCVSSTQLWFSDLPPARSLGFYIPVTQGCSWSFSTQWSSVAKPPPHGSNRPPPAGLAASPWASSAEHNFAPNASKEIRRLEFLHWSQLHLAVVGCDWCPDLIPLLSHQAPLQPCSALTKMMGRKVAVTCAFGTSAAGAHQQPRHFSPSARR